MNKEEKLRVKERIHHLAFIMDGNGRWAKERGKARSAGHKKGVEVVHDIVDEAFFAYGIKAVSLYVFSTENWNRDPEEIKYLFSLLKRFFKNFLSKFEKRGVRILVSGDLSDPRIPADVVASIDEAQQKTAHNEDHYFNVLFNYGGRRELVNAFHSISRDIQNGIINLSEVDEDIIRRHLYQPLLPDVDLLIRTSGEKRISNCLLYELAYAEFIFTAVYWPSYSIEELEKNISDFISRKRRFGGIKEDE